MTNKTTSTSHRYNPARYQQGDCFNSHVDSKQDVTPVTPEEKAAAISKREQVIRQAAASLHTEPQGFAVEQQQLAVPAAKPNAVRTERYANVAEPAE